MASETLVTKIVLTFVYGIISIVGITGNFMVISVVLWVRKMLNSTNCYLLSLATSDLLFFLAAMPVEFSYLYGYATNYVFGSIGCHVLTYLSYLSINTSALSIMVFTVERYIGICHPMVARKFCTVERATTNILLMWLISTIYNLPWAFLATLKTGNITLNGTETGNITLNGTETGNITLNGTETGNITLNGTETGIESRYCTFAVDRQSLQYKLIFGGDFVAFYLLPILLYVFLYGKIMISLSSSSNLPTAGTIIRKSRSAGRNSEFTSGISLNMSRSPSHLSLDGHRRTSKDIINRRFSSNVSNLTPSQDNIQARRHSERYQRIIRRSPSDHNHLGPNDDHENKEIVSRDRRVCSQPNISSHIEGDLKRTQSNMTRCSNTGRRRKALKLLAVIPVAFAICWMPYRAMVMYNSFTTNTWKPKEFILFAKTMVFVSSAINPILYNFMSSRFRRSFKTLLEFIAVRFSFGFWWYNRMFQQKILRHHPVDIQQPSTRITNRTSKSLESTARRRIDIHISPPPLSAVKEISSTAV